MEPIKNNRLLIAFYGDDFTGSTDALEFLARSGAKTVLFIEPPSTAQLARYTDLQAIGVAGRSRTMTPAEMEKQLTPAFKALADLNPYHVHYKVCSTFDSSPTVGSIGKAIDIGRAIFPAVYLPLLVSAPHLGRYCLFGNLFARMGIGSEGEIHRLDRHPSMCKHPVTPADEADLRLHLAKQTNKNIGLFDILELHKDQLGSTKLSDLLEAGNEVILFDALDQKDMDDLGMIIDQQAKDENIIFSVGSSGIEVALGSQWQKNGKIEKKNEWESTDATGPVLIASGSCSPVTSAQIRYAINNGFSEIAIDTESLAQQLSSDEDFMSSSFLEDAARQYVSKVSGLIEQGKNVLIHTSLGNDDLRNLNTDKILKGKGLDKSVTALLYGSLLGYIARYTAEKTALKRIIVAGGDTSSYAARAMGIEAVEMIAPLSPGAPLCRAFAPGSSIDQLQVAFKGGQVGKEDFFVKATIQNDKF